jgi:hypothetical protein
MDIVLWDLSGTECYTYIDDVIIFSKSVEKHALSLENVLRGLDEANLQLHPVRTTPSAIFGFRTFRTKSVSFLRKGESGNELPNAEKRQGRSRVCGPGIILPPAGPEICRNFEIPDNFD